MVLRLLLLCLGFLVFSCVRKNGRSKWVCEGIGKPQMRYTYSNVPSSSLPTMVMIISELEELGHCCCCCSFFISTIGWDCASSGSLVLEVLSVPAEEEDLQGLGDMIMCVTKDSVSADMV